MWRFKLIVIFDVDGHHFVAGRVPKAIPVDIASYRLFQGIGPYIPVSFSVLLPVENADAWMCARQSEGFAFEAANLDSPAWKGIAEALQSPTEYITEKWHHMTVAIADVFMQSENRGHRTC
jgi:hypothetical protein